MVAGNIDESNPLLGQVRTLSDERWTNGNTSLMNLNLSHNRVTNGGLMSLHSALNDQNECRSNNDGLKRLSIMKNSFQNNDEIYANIQDMLKSRYTL